MEKKIETEVFQDCPIADIQPIVRGKWTMVIVFFLSKGTLRFKELARKMPMVTEANLTKELRSLEKYGLVHREVYREVPPKVEYSLTDVGRMFLPVIQDLEIFAQEYQKVFGECNEEVNNS